MEQIMTTAAGLVLRLIMLENNNSVILHQVIETLVNSLWWVKIRYMWSGGGKNTHT